MVEVIVLRRAIPNKTEPLLKGFPKYQTVVKYNVAAFRNSIFVQLNALLSDVKTSYSIFKSSLPLLKIHDAFYNTDISLPWTI